MVARERDLLRNKGYDYTAGQGDRDAYHNFRQVATFLEGAPITPYTVAMVYALKHLFSLLTFCKTGIQESGEGLEGRHSDLRNYGFILQELVPDHLNHFEQIADRLERMWDAVKGLRIPEDNSISGHEHNFPEPCLDEEVLYEAEGMRVVITSDMDQCWRTDTETLKTVPITPENPEDIEDDFEREWLDKIEIQNGKEECPTIDDVNGELRDL